MITAMIRYYGKGDDAMKFANEMISSGIVDEIRTKEGNLKYEYFKPLDEDGSIVLIDSWASQEALDDHHHSSTMGKIAALREKYDLHMEVHKYNEVIDQKDEKYIRR